MGRRSAGGGKDGASATPEPRQRLDRWIWHARFQRSREACADLIRKGHVRVNAMRVTQPGHAICKGDILTLALSRCTIVIRVDDCRERRGSPAEARALFSLIEGTLPGLDPEADAAKKA